MRGFFSLAVAATCALAGRGLATPLMKRATPVSPGNADDIIITSKNTVNATVPAPVNSTASVSDHDTVNATTPANSTSLGNSTIRVSARTVAANGKLPLSLVNHFAGSVKAYVTGLDPDNRLVMLRPSGEWFYPTSDASQTTPQRITANVAIPLGAQGSTTTVTLPGYISAARVWFAADGDLSFFTVWSPASNGPSLVEPSSNNPSDPSAACNWGFVELTYIANGGLFANISYVDFVGLVLGMSLRVSDGTTQTAQGLRPDAVSKICAGLKAQTAKDGQPWGNLCMVDGSGNPLRITAPSDYVASNPHAFSNYFTAYIDSVWTKYTTSTLTMNTQGAAGNVACKVRGGLLICEGDNRGYTKPSAGDIFGCNGGPFAIQAGDNAIHRAIVPRLCAAFDRTTLMMTGGNTQPGLSSTSYYLRKPTNWYSALVHQNEVDGKGYAFPYDDVNPDGENQSGVVASASPSVLTVTIGGP